MSSNQIMGGRMSGKTYAALSYVKNRPCSFCESREWAAKNDRYCTNCADEYLDIECQVVSQYENPLQKIADEVMERHEF